MSPKTKNRMCYTSQNHFLHGNVDGNLPVALTSTSSMSMLVIDNSDFLVPILTFRFLTRFESQQLEKLILARQRRYDVNIPSKRKS